MFEVDCSSIMYASNNYSTAPPSLERPAAAMTTAMERGSKQHPHAKVETLESYMSLQDVCLPVVVGFSLESCGNSMGGGETDGFEANSAARSTSTDAVRNKNDVRDSAPPLVDASCIDSSSSNGQSSDSDAQPSPRAGQHGLRRELKGFALNSHIPQAAAVPVVTLSRPKLKAEAEGTVEAPIPITTETMVEVRGRIVKRVAHVCPFEGCAYSSPGTGHLFRRG